MIALLRGATRRARGGICWVNRVIRFFIAFWKDRVEGRERRKGRAFCVLLAPGELVFVYKILRMDVHRWDFCIPLDELMDGICIVSV